MQKDNSSIDRKSFANVIFFQTGFVQVKLHVFKASKQYVLQQNGKESCNLYPTKFVTNLEIHKIGSFQIIVYAN